MVRALGEAGGEVLILHFKQANSCVLRVQGFREVIEAHNSQRESGKIIGFDGQLEGKQAIKEGKIYADPVQFPDRMGVASVQNILKYLNGEPFEPIQLIPAELYTKSEAEQDPALH